MTADTAPEPTMFILQCTKRAVSRTSRDSKEWEPDEESFLRRWPNNARPDIGVQRSTDARQLIKAANRANEAQIGANFLDWLYYVDVDTPVHNKCDSSCPTWREE